MKPRAFSQHASLQSVPPHLCGCDAPSRAFTPPPSSTSEPGRRRRGRRRCGVLRLTSCGGGFVLRLTDRAEHGLVLVRRLIIARRLEEEILEHRVSWQDETIDVARAEERQ